MYVLYIEAAKGCFFKTKFAFCRGKIVWADQQTTVRRFKRDYVSLADLESEKPLTREKRLQFDVYGAVSNAVNNAEGDYKTAHGTRMFNDELWGQEWYLVIMLSELSPKFCCNRERWPRYINNKYVLRNSLLIAKIQRCVLMHSSNK
jgi:hypothetical protein